MSSSNTRWVGPTRELSGRSDHHDAAPGPNAPIGAGGDGTSTGRSRM